MEQLKHECGVAMIRLLKPQSYYKEKYGTSTYALDKLYLLMEKQHNRGQEGAGMACLKLSAKPGEEYMFRERAVGTGAITEVFDTIHRHTESYQADIYMGHLRYSTTGRQGLEYVHPFLRRNNWRVNNLALCGNFNLSNTEEVFNHIVAGGQHPRRYADTYILLEQLGHKLDREVERVYAECSGEGLEGAELTGAIESRVDMARVLRQASGLWDGGYVICGLTGSGETFAIRDPWGIRTAFYYADHEVLVLASERPVIQTVMNVDAACISELQPGQALLTGKSGQWRLEQINSPREKRACSFERIYFSRGSDADIYRERKQLGRNLVPAILKAVGGDVEHTVFSYIPNTAEAAYYGMLEGLDEWLNHEKAKKIEALGHKPAHDELARILSTHIRHEKVAIKDIKLRTFIAEGASRNNLAAHVYDVTYGSLRPNVDNLVVIDDSIVRGTTLRQSIISILDRLCPKKIVIVSSAPQIRYPDFYGIDMASMDQLIAFRATVSLLRGSGLGHVIDTQYRMALDAAEDGKAAANCVKELYAHFTDDEVSAQIARMLTPAGTKAEVQVIFQTIEGLHNACPEHLGDWYFSGDYPTPGGVKLLNSAFTDYVDKANRQDGV